MSRLLDALGAAAQCIATAAGDLGTVGYLTPPAAGALYERVDAHVAQSIALLDAARGELAAMLTARPVDRAAALDRVLDERYPGRHAAGRERTGGHQPPATGRASVPRRLAVGTVAQARESYDRWR